MTNGLSFHVIHDAIYQQTASLYPILDTLQPRTINIVGGARKPEAANLAVDLLKRYPKMRVIFRNFLKIDHYPPTDDGNHAKTRYQLIYHRDSSGKLVVDDMEGVRNWIKDNREYLERGLTVLTDNESVREDIDVYAMWQSLIMDICAEKGWKVAVGRFAVGNPRETDYAKLDFMWRSLAKHHPLHCWSPNEYLPPDISTASGMLGRYKLGIAAAKAIGAWPFDVSIGEYGIVYRHGNGVLDAEAGYKDARIGWSGKQAARFLINNWKTWYQPDNVDAAIYCYGDSDGGKWARFRVENDGGFMDELLNAARAGELKVEAMAETPLPKPPSYEANVEYLIDVPANYANVRKTPAINAEIVGMLSDNDVVTIEGEKLVGNDYWRNISVVGKNIVGWVSMQYDAAKGDYRVKYLKKPIVVPPPPPPPPPDPEPEPVPVPLPVPYVEITAEKALQFAEICAALAKHQMAAAAANTATAQEYKQLEAIWKAIADTTARTQSVTKQAA